MSDQVEKSPLSMKEIFEIDDLFDPLENYLDFTTIEDAEVVEDSTALTF